MEEKQKILSRRERLLRFNRRPENQLDTSKNNVTPNRNHKPSEGRKGEEAKYLKQQSPVRCEGDHRSHSRAEAVSHRSRDISPGKIGKFLEGSEVRHKVIPKDPRVGIENEWHAVFSYRDRVDQCEEAAERSAERLKRKLYRQKLDEQSRFLEKKRNIEREKERQADSEMIAKQRNNILQTSFKEKEELEAMKWLYDKAINSTLNEKMLFIEKQKAEAENEKKRLRREMELALREAEEIERKKKQQVREELVASYEEQTLKKKKLKEQEREQEIRQYSELYALEEAKEKKEIELQQLQEKKKKEYFNQDLAKQLLLKKERIRQNYFMNSYEKKLNHSLIEGYTRDSTLPEVNNRIKFNLPHEIPSAIQVNSLEIKEEDKIQTLQGLPKCLQRAPPQLIQEAGLPGGYFHNRRKSYNSRIFFF